MAHPNSVEAYTALKATGGDEKMYDKIMRIIGQGSMTVHDIEPHLRAMGCKSAVRNIAARCTEMESMGMLRVVGSKDVENKANSIYVNTFTRTSDKYVPKHGYKKPYLEACEKIKELEEYIEWLEKVIDGYQKS